MKEKIDLEDISRVVDALTARMSDDGNLIEGGWLALKASTLSPDTPVQELKERRMMFFAGAQHLFASIMNILDPGEEPTQRDLDRLSSIHVELANYIKEYKQEHLS